MSYFNYKDNDLAYIPANEVPYKNQDIFVVPKSAYELEVPRTQYGFGNSVLKSYAKENLQLGSYSIIPPSKKTTLVNAFYDGQKDMAPPIFVNLNNTPKTQFLEENIPKWNLIPPEEKEKMNMQHSLDFHFQRTDRNLWVGLILLGIIFLVGSKL